MEKFIRRDSINTIVESDRITFVETRKEEVDRIKEIEDDEENSKYIFSWPKKRHLKAIDKPDEMLVSIKPKGDDSIIGYILFTGIGDIDGSIECKRIAIDEKGKGYGRETMKLIKEFALEKEECHRLWLDVYDDNHIALSLYLSEGFNIEGVLRESKKGENGYRSLIVLSILEKEYDI